MNAYARLRPPSEPAPTADQRRARNLDYCEYLIERGMDLARAASDRALDDIAAPPQVARIPGSSAAEIDQLREESRRRGPDCGKLFTQLSRAIRQTMLLETFLAEGHTPTPQAATQAERRPPTEPPKPRLHQDPLRRETLERLDCALPTGPDGEIRVEDALLHIVQDLGLRVIPPASPADREPVETPDHPGPDRPRQPGHHPETQALPRPHRRW